MSNERTITIPGNELVLGDHVQIDTGPYGWGTVFKLDTQNGCAHVFRPFVHLAEFVYTGGVPHYTGTETFPILLEGRSYRVDSNEHEHRTGKGRL